MQDLSEPSKVVMDACVLIPMPLADTLLRIASGPKSFLPIWSDGIMKEVGRNLMDSFGLSQGQVTYREAELLRHFPESMVEGYEDRIPSMTNQQKDRHVLAAAVRGKGRRDRYLQPERFSLPFVAGLRDSGHEPG